MNTCSGNTFKTVTVGEMVTVYSKHNNVSYNMIDNITLIDCSNEEVMFDINKK